MIVRSRAGDRGPWPETFAVGRWDDDRRTPRPGGLVDGDRVIGRISGDAHERALDGGEQIEGGGRIIPRRLGQRVDTDHAGLIDAKVELPPATSAAATAYGATKRPRLANRRNKVGASGCFPSSLRECPTLCASSYSRPLAG